MQLKGLFKCTGKRFKVCLLYVNEGNRFVISSNMRWELRSHGTCRDIDVTYYLKRNMCDHKETYIGKTVGDNIVCFKSRIKQHISDCRTSTSTCKFPIDVLHCAMKNKRLKEPHFQLNIMMKVKDSWRLEFFENYFHKKGYDIINCPECLKKYLNLLS